MLKCLYLEKLVFFIRSEPFSSEMYNLLRQDLFMVEYGCQGFCVFRVALHCRVSGFAVTSVHEVLCVLQQSTHTEPEFCYMDVVTKLRIFLYSLWNCDITTWFKNECQGISTDYAVLAIISLTLYRSLVCISHQKTIYIYRNN